MTTPACRHECGRLAEALKALRAGAGLSGADAASGQGQGRSKLAVAMSRRGCPAAVGHVLATERLVLCPVTTDDHAALLAL